MKTSLPYEIHVTVEEGYVNPFKVACLALGVKPLLIQAQRDGEYDMESFEDLQTSSVIRGTLSDVWAELDRIREGLTEAGFTVIREKVETCPEYPDAPALSKESQEMPIGCYFEAHIPVEMPNDSWLESRLERLGEIAKQHSAHLSRNAFKAEEEVAIFMVTLRDHHSPLEGFEWAKCKLEDCLYSEGFNTASPFSAIIEFVVHDSNLAHDDKWVGKPPE